MSTTSGGPTLFDRHHLERLLASAEPGEFLLYRDLETAHILLSVRWASSGLHPPASNILPASSCILLQASSCLHHPASSCKHHPACIFLHASYCLDHPASSCLHHPFCIILLHHSAFIILSAPPACIILYASSCLYHPACIIQHASSCLYHPACIILPASSCLHHPACIILYALSACIILLASSCPHHSACLPPRSLNTLIFFSSPPNGTSVLPLQTLPLSFLHLSLRSLLLSFFTSLLINYTLLFLSPLAFLLTKFHLPSFTSSIFFSSFPPYLYFFFFYTFSHFTPLSLSLLILLSSPFFASFFFNFRPFSRLNVQPNSLPALCALYG